jgi:isocitrate/isopropylmalate dehydrogenase
MIRIAVIPGDGIGPEVICEARNVLHTVAAATGKDIRVTEFDLYRDLEGPDGVACERSLFLGPEQLAGVWEAL